MSIDDSSMIIKSQHIVALTANTQEVKTVPICAVERSVIRLQTGQVVTISATNHFEPHAHRETVGRLGVWCQFTQVVIQSIHFVVFTT